MTLERIRDILNCQVLTGEDGLGREVTSGCGADLMSDVLAFVRPNSVLLTGLTHIQTVRTADVAEVRAIVYVRGKLPDRDAVELAKKRGIVLLATRLPMFEACGRLYACGLRGGSEIEDEAEDARRTPLPSAL